jgi:hypothetical protein
LINNAKSALNTYIVHIKLINNNRKLGSEISQSQR